MRGDQVREGGVGGEGVAIGLGLLGGVGGGVGLCGFERGEVGVAVVLEA